MRHKYNIFLLLAVVLLSYTVSSCDSSESGEDIVPTYVDVSFSLSTKAPVSRADENPAPRPEELIKSWWVVFVGKTDNIVHAIIDGNLETSVNNTDVYTSRVPSGSYIVYAFANVSQNDLKEQTGLEFSPLSAAPNVADSYWNKVDNGSNNLVNGWDKAKYVPMSGFKEVTVTKGTSFEIEVVRLLAKVEFEFKSQATELVEVKYVSLLHLMDGRVMLMPDYVKLFNEPKEPFCTPGDRSEFKYAFSTPLTISPSGNPQSDWFYVREAVADAHPTGHFIVHVGTKRNGREEVAMYAMAEELTYINRNDHIIFPITFTDYIIEPGALFYPPIGGYPAVAVDINDDECYIKFGTEGRFVINVQVRDAKTGALVIDPGKVKVELNRDKTIDDPAGILAQRPAPDAVTGEFSGQLNTNTGTAIIPVKITVNVSDEISRIYDRTIYVIRV